MAPREPYKVHSLKKHIADTQKSLSSDTKRRPTATKLVPIKKEPDTANNDIFNNSDDSDDDSNGNDSDSSEDEGGSSFLRKLTASTKTGTPVSKRRNKDEEIADSDVERQKNSKKSKKSKSESTSDSESSDSSSEEDDSESAPKTNGKPNAVLNTKDGDSSSESESESESEDDSPPSAQQPKVESKSSTSEESSDEESEEETSSADSSKLSVQPNGAAGNGANAKVDSSTSSEESSEDESEDEAPVSKPAEADSSSEGEEEDDDQQEVDESMHISDRGGSQQIAVPNTIAPDFMLRKGLEGANGQDVAKVCSEANLQGKQFFYFTVPSNVPVSVVQNLEIPMDQSQRGDHVFSHNGEKYGISFDSMTPKSTIQILIPSADGLQYRSAPRQVDQIMQVKRITQLGAPSTEDSAVGPAPKAAARPQPEGLRARFKPIGVYDAPAADSEDAEMLDAPEPVVEESSTKKEKKDKGKKKDKKAKADAEQAANSTIPSSFTPAKKRKHTASEDDAFAASSQLQEESQSADLGTKKRRKERKGSPDLGSEIQTGSRKETPVLPPTIPSSLPTLNSSQAAATPTPKPKKSKKVKSTASPAPPSSMETHAASSAQTPVTARQSHVPLPSIPGSSQPKNSPVPVPHPGPSSTPTTARTEKKKSKSVKEKNKDSKPSSSQTKSKTPVPPPVVKGMG